MMRSIRVVSVLAAFGAGSAMAATCYVKGEKGCASGSVVKVDGIDQCKVGEESPELAFYKTKKDCATGRGGSVAAADDAAARIAGESGRKRAGRTPPGACFFSVPEANGQTTCVQGAVSPADKVFPVMPAQVSGASLCTANGWQVSRYRTDAGCRGKPTENVKVCWIMKKDSSQCETARIGFIEGAGEGKESSVDVCNVAGETEMDFFFDNHCEQGNLAWKANLSGKISGEKTADRNAIKPIVVEPVNCAECDPNPPAKKAEARKPVRTERPPKTATDGG